MQHGIWDSYGYVKVLYNEHNDFFKYKPFLFSWSSVQEGLYILGDEV